MTRAPTAQKVSIQGNVMGFIPQTAVDTNAVLDSLRVSLQHNVHTGERVMDVALDTLSDIVHLSAVAGNGCALSSMELQQSLMASRNCSDVWHSLWNYSARLHDHYFKYMDGCFASRHRAMDRLHAEDGYVG